MDTKEYYRFAASRGNGRWRYGALSALRGNHDIVVMEGAGSPAEINVPFDMANMRMAGAAGAAGGDRGSGHRKGRLLCADGGHHSAAGGTATARWYAAL